MSTGEKAALVLLAICGWRFWRGLIYLVDDRLLVGWANIASGAIGLYVAIVALRFGWGPPWL